MFGAGFSFLSNSQGVSTGVAYDTDAQAFFTSYGITDLTEKTATNQLVLDLKSGGFWSGIVYFMPYLGGTSFSCSGNLKNPATYQMTWYSGTTFDSKGVTFNGSSGYGDNGFYPNVMSSINSLCIGTKFNANFTGGGGFPFGTTTGSRIQIYRSFSDLYFSLNSGVESYTSLADIGGNIILNRNSSTNQAIYKNGTLLINDSASSSSFSTTKLFLGCRSTSGDTPSGYSPHKQNYFMVSNGVSDVAGLNTIIQTWLTALGK